MLDVRRMQVLRAVVTGGSMTAAAANLGYTPSAVSQQIAALEQEAGIALLERVGRGVRPTAAGRLVIRHAATVSQQLAELETELADLRAGRAGRLAIRYFTSVGPTLVAPALARFRREYPGVQIDLRLNESSDPFAGPKDPFSAPEGDRPDLALIVRSPDAERPGIRLVHLIDDAYLAVLPAGHPLAARPEAELELADLAGEPWIGSEPPGPCLDPILNACAAAGFTPNFVARSEDYATTQGFVAAGLGVGLLPRLGLTSRHPGVTVRAIRHPEPVRAICAAVPDPSPAQPALRALLDVLRDEAHRHRG